MIKRIFFILTIISSVISCSDDDEFTTSRSSLLTFSTDTVRMDTVFSTVGSSIYSFWIYNTGNKGIRIARSYLKKGNQTGFRVNVDGIYLDNTTGSSLTDIEIRRGDSIRVFVELLAACNFQTEAQLLSDDLIFQLESGAEQKMPLKGYAWDALFIENGIIDKDSIITSEKPIVIYGSLTVKEGVKLTICKTRLFFHDKAGLNIHGTLITDSVLMRGDRLDHMFDYLPYDRISGQWGGITFYSTSFYNELVDTEIHGGEFGIRCDSARVSPNDIRLYMERCMIHNCKGHGVELTNTYASLVDCQVTNMLGDCLKINGGAVNVYGCTIGQFYPFDANRGVALRFNNGIDNHIYSLEQMDCKNSIITGYGKDEMMGTQVDENASFEYLFENCLIRTPKIEDENHFKTIIWEQPTDSIQGKKHFVKIDERNFIYDFHLVEKSPAVGLGCYR